jgi:hypothetical protein
MTDTADKTERARVVREVVQIIASEGAAWSHGLIAYIAEQRYPGCNYDHVRDGAYLDAFPGGYHGTSSQ